MAKEIYSLNNNLLNNHWTKPNQEILQILNVSDLKDTKYVLNETNVFAINQNTLYFPNAKDGEIIYIEYKPKPMVYTIKDMNKEVDIPDTLLETLYSFVAMKVTSGIESYREFHNIAVGEYINNIKENIMNGSVLQDSLEGLNTQEKGFV